MKQGGNSVTVPYEPYSFDAASLRGFRVRMFLQLQGWHILLCVVFLFFFVLFAVKLIRDKRYGIFLTYGAAVAAVYLISGIFDPAESFQIIWRLPFAVNLALDTVAVLVFAAVGAVYAAVSGQSFSPLYRKFSSREKKARFDWKGAILLPLLIGFGYAMFLFVINDSLSVDRNPGFHLLRSTYIALPLDFPLLALRRAVAAFSVAIFCQTVFFTGIQSFLKVQMKKMNVVVPILISAVLCVFYLSHGLLGNWLLVLEIFPLLAAMGFIFEKKGAGASVLLFWSYLVTYALFFDRLAS